MFDFTNEWVVFAIDCIMDGEGNGIKINGHRLNRTHY